MADSKDKLFVAKVVEVIKDSGTPTLELRVRIPTLHGDEQTGLRDSELPLAKPMLLPGTVLDSSRFDENIVGSIIYVILEYGLVTNPMYFGLKGTKGDYVATSEVVPYATEFVPGVVRVKKVGNTGYIYTSKYIP